MNVYTNFPLKNILYYKIGGEAKILLTIQTKKDLEEAFEYIKNNPTEKILPIGLGSNLLVTDRGFDGIVLWFSKPEHSSFRLNNSTVEAFSSEILDDLIHFAFKHNLIGLEWAGGLPSTVGAAVRGNVGAFGKEIKDVFLKAEVFELSNGSYVRKELTKEDMLFSYRKSFVKQRKNTIVSNVFFSLSQSDNQGLKQAQQVYNSNIEYRQKNHPIEYPSCGSVFKNIVRKDEVEKILFVWSDAKELSEQKWHNKIAMGYVIKRLGFSGFQVGGAQVSTKHANYIVNINKAKFTDIISIIEKIKEKFQKTFGSSPELELEIVY